MYTYYCKDANCQGHTKSWERCCDMRAFSTRRTFAAPPQAGGKAHFRTVGAPQRKSIFA